MLLNDRKAGIAIVVLLTCLAGCKKLVTIDPPVNSITTSQVFIDSADATAALSGVYNYLADNDQSSGLYIGNGALSIYTGSSADELLPFNYPGDEVSTNALLPDNGVTGGSVWSPAYQYIYQLNAILEGLQASSGIAGATKTQLTGEAKFLRAFCYFYLVNLFGDIPYVTSSAWAQTQSTPRTPAVQVWQSIIADLKAAQSSLRTDYSVSRNERTRANQWAAMALLARVYLYQKDYADAASLATSIIANTGTFSLAGDPNLVYLKNSQEAILQWQLNAGYWPYNATVEGYNIIPLDRTTYPYYYITDQLLNAFEPSDRRRTAWVDSTIYSGTVYYYPDKYKIGPAQMTPTAATTEYYMVLRLAEQYLIRAEARAQQNDPADAVNDLNVLRARAGLTPLPAGLNKDQALAAVAQERRIELFAEWGHRWLDLKRTGQVDSVMTIATPLKGGGTTWQSYQQIYPIPSSELANDPNLTQNPGYPN